MIPIVKEIIVYSRYDIYIYIYIYIYFFFPLPFPFGLLIQMVLAMVDNENSNCFEVALLQVARSTNVIKQGSKKIFKI